MTNKKVLSIFSIIMINIIAVASLRSLPILAASGGTLIGLFMIASFGFFIPTALISAELASKWPKLGGLYVWIKEAFGPNTAFIVIWIQWIYNVVWYPTILTFIATAILSLIDPILFQKTLYILPLVLIMFWLTTLIHFFGIRISSWVSTFGAIIGTLIPMIAIIVLGSLWLMQQQPIAINFATENIFPRFSNWQSFVGLTIVLFSLVGIEMSAVHAEDAKNPRKAYPIALAISAIIILGGLLFGSLSISLVVPQKALNLVSGVIDAFNVFFKHYSLGGFTVTIALLIIISGLCSVSTWIIGPTKGLLAAADDGCLPHWLQKRNKNGVPTSILWSQGILFSLLCSVFILMESVNSSYWLLSILTSQLALLNYVILFAAAFKLRLLYPERKKQFKIPGGLWGIGILSLIGIITSVFAILIGFVPPSSIDIGNPLKYQLILLFGMILLIMPPFVTAFILQKTK